MEPITANPPDCHSEVNFAVESDEDYRQMVADMAEDFEPTVRDMNPEQFSDEEIESYVAEEIIVEFLAENPSVPALDLYYLSQIVRDVVDNLLEFYHEPA